MTGRAGSDAAFVAALRGLCASDDRGALAALRRGLGKPAGTAAEMFPYVVPWLPQPVSRWDEDCFYVVASLCAWHPDSWPHDGPAGHPASNLGASLARLRAATTSDSAERSLVALLNSDREDVAGRLRRVVGLLRSHAVAVDWLQLLRDLRAWDAPDRWAQRAWARAFWGGAGAAPANTSSGDAAEAVPPRAAGAAHEPASLMSDAQPELQSDQ